MSDARDTYISQVAAGKSFADVGGLWGTVNEKVSVAHTHGARALTMIDVSPPDTELWVLSEMGRSASRRRWRSGVLKISVPGGGCRRLRRSEPCAKWPGFVMKPVPELEWQCLYLAAVCSVVGHDQRQTERRAGEGGRRMHILMRFVFNLRHVREANGGDRPCLALVIDERTGVAPDEVRRLLQAWRDWLSVDAVLVCSAPLEPDSSRGECLLPADLWGS